MGWPCPAFLPFLLLLPSQVSRNPPGSRRTGWLFQKSRLRGQGAGDGSCVPDWAPSLSCLWNPPDGQTLPLMVLPFAVFPLYLPDGLPPLWYPLLPFYPYLYDPGHPSLTVYLHVPGRLCLMVHLHVPDYLNLTVHLYVPDCLYLPVSPDYPQPLPLLLLPFHPLSRPLEELLPPRKKFRYPGCRPGRFLLALRELHCCRFYLRFPQMLRLTAPPRNALVFPGVPLSPHHFVLLPPLLFLLPLLFLPPPSPKAPLPPGRKRCKPPVRFPLTPGTGWGSLSFRRQIPSLWPFPPVPLLPSPFQMDG
ncbi:unknown [Clostridium sp. CAG:149]|nr:unknown [Clostridium sp. CAG:149]